MNFITSPMSKNRTEALTAREIEILEHLAKGKLNKEISIELEITLDTVKNT